MTRYGWFVLINQHNIVNGGCDGIFPCYLKTENHKRQVAEELKAKRNCKEIYFLTDAQYTQEVCEMNMGRFIDYIRKVGQRL